MGNASVSNVFCNKGHVHRMTSQDGWTGSLVVSLWQSWVSGGPGRPLGVLVMPRGCAAASCRKTTALWENDDVEDDKKIYLDENRALLNPGKVGAGVWLNNILK